MRKFKNFAHTADIGIEVWGRTPAELFENAAVGMFAQIVDYGLRITDYELNPQSPIRNQQPPINNQQSAIHIEVEADNREFLLVAFLQELLYNFETKKILFKKFEITYLDDRNIKCIARGEKITSPHQIVREIKAVTYHLLKIEKDEEKNIWRTKILFDV